MLMKTVITACPQQLFSCVPLLRQIFRGKNWEKVGMEKTAKPNAYDNC